MSARVIRSMIVAACSFGLGGCSPFNRSVSEAELLKSDEYVIVPDVDLPRVSGVQGCGAQALAAVLAYEADSTAGQSADAAALAEQLPWHDVGATPVDLLLEARQRGFNATITRGSIDDLARNIADGRPVLIMLDSGLEVRGLLFGRYPTPNVMHWAVVSGIAIDHSRVLLASEHHRHHVARREDFELRWSQSDNCMIVVRPGGEEASEHP